MYLDCLDPRGLRITDNRTPRILYMDKKKLSKLAHTDMFGDGGTDNPRTWFFGVHPVSDHVLLFF